MCCFVSQVTVHQTESGGEKARVKVGKLYMIDLAGSERAKKTQVIRQRICGQQRWVGGGYTL